MVAGRFPALILLSPVRTGMTTPFHFPPKLGRTKFGHSGVLETLPPKGLSYRRALATRGLEQEDDQLP